MKQQKVRSDFLPATYIESQKHKKQSNNNMATCSVKM